VSDDRYSRAQCGQQERRPGRWLVPLAAALVVLASAALAGWQTGWPRPVFGVQKAALDSRARPASVPAPVTSGAFPVTPNPDSPPTARTDPAAVVEGYFSAIDDRDYRIAWALGGKNTGSSYREFVQGFSGTAHDTVTILALDGNDVTARLVAGQDDGTVKTFQGTYTVTSGAITHFDVAQTGPA